MGLFDQNNEPLSNIDVAFSFVNVKELISALLGVWLGTAPFGVKLMGDLALSDWISTRFRVNLALLRVSFSSKKSRP